MFKKIFSKSKNKKRKKSALPREAQVRVISIDKNRKIPKIRSEVIEEELITEEGPKFKNILNGIAIGGAIGAFICLISYLFGISISPAETIVMMGFPIFFGALIGYALF